MGLGPGELAALAVAALLVGFAKTAVGGVGSISVALFAAVLPARESTGALLPLLILGDVVAVVTYRRHADWAALWRLFPAVGAGVLVGAVFIARVDDVVMRRTIGVILLVLVAITLLTRRAAVPAGPPPPGAWRRPAALGYGSAAGFTTMVANAGGPVMSLYLLSARLTMLAFLGTAAWFFLIVNVSKVPFSVGLGLLTWDSLVLDAVLAPAVVVGALVGRRVIGRLSQQTFERLVIGFTVLAALNLVR